MIRVDAEPMKGTSEEKMAGDTSGLWKVVSYDQGTGSIIQNSPGRIRATNLTYDEALKMADELENRLNPNSVKCE